MSKKVLKIAFVLVMLLLFVFVNYVQASGFIGDIEQNISGGTGSNVGNTIKNFGGTIIGVIQVVGTGIGIIMLIYIAIKYMIAAPSEKAEFKKTAINFVIGAVVLFAASGILGLIKNIMENLSGTLSK